MRIIVRVRSPGRMAGISRARRLSPVRRAPTPLPAQSYRSVMPPNRCRKQRMHRNLAPGLRQAVTEGVDRAIGVGPKTSCRREDPPRGAERQEGIDLTHHRPRLHQRHCRRRRGRRHFAHPPGLRYYAAQPAVASLPSCKCGICARGNWRARSKHPRMQRILIRRSRLSQMKPHDPTYHNPPRARWAMPSARASHIMFSTGAFAPIANSDGRSFGHRPCFSMPHWISCRRHPAGSSPLLIRVRKSSMP